MTKKCLLPFILFLFLSLHTNAQKVKYKDVFGLLSTKQYEQAEPFLKKYVKDNNDNPNAFLHMGIIFQEKALKMDVLKQTQSVIAYMDSSSLFYDKAYKTIDEREVKRNKEYYQAYNRRDIRTGEFGVKLSDIQFDIEKKIQGLRERIDRVKMVAYYFSLTDSLYSGCSSLYTSLKKSYPSENQLYLRADESTLKALSSLSLKYDSCLKAFDNYKSAVVNLGKTGYNQNLTITEITDFGTEGHTPADFYHDEVEIWDFKKFANSAKETIEKEIIPMRSRLVSYDAAINKLRDKLSADSVSVRNDLVKLSDKSLCELVAKFDPAPLPMQVFSMKTSEIEYRSYLIEHKTRRDSSNLHYKIALLKEEMNSLNTLDSVSAEVLASDLDVKAADYHHFVTNTFNNTTVLQAYINTLRDFALREKKKKDEELAQLQESLNWIVDGADSIPLTLTQTTLKYQALFTEDERYTVGLALKDSLTSEGYFYTIMSSRKPVLKVKFPVDKASFKKARLPYVKALTYSDPTAQMYYVLIYTEREVKEKYMATLAKVYKSDGLAWSNTIALNFIPKEISFTPETSELSIKDETKLLVVDKNGKVLR